MTDSHLIPTTLSTARKETSQDIESTPPGISSHMRRLKKKNEPKQNFGGPKMSTPKSLNMLQHDQESFCKQQQRIHDDFGVNRPCLEKENSWEPSIHSSLPPSPKICISELAAFNMTDSHLIPTTLSTARKETSQDIESTPPGISSHMRRLKKKNEPKQNFGGPKMSTPKCKSCMYFPFL
ncbi:hypothetical protein WUBG_14019 [Wuchereria bancrofti]|uniref:Uncharacterized protein n=1 Tax=Wuchereria bancrofti TaxID=6293 RepID=J9DZ03_WUCBA|nr:hypothetical protein WUBG_14019 [Wuchereria bancrofti]